MGIVHSYSTAFPLTENPISQGGAWFSGPSGLTRQNVRTTGGLCCGLNDFDGTHFDDSIAVLNPAVVGQFTPNQRVTATIHSVNQNGLMNQEVEIHLRSVLDPTNSTGYEMMVKCAHDGTQYTEIVRWDPAAAVSLSFHNNTVFTRGVFDGDVLIAEAIGSTFNLYIGATADTATLINTATDSTYTGNPGVGFWLNRNGQSGSVATNLDFGFSSFVATDL